MHSWQISKKQNWGKEICPIFFKDRRPLGRSFCKIERKGAKR